MQPKISIIVPIYNTEPYLEKCLESISHQSLQEIEILCVDDVSPDQSASIVQDLAQTDSRIKLIRHTRNLGQGGARNTGIANAQANYIANVDSDDWIDPEMFKRLYEETQNESIDIVCCGWKHINDEGSLISEQGRKPGLFDNTSNQLNIFSVLNPALWNKLIRKSLYLNNGIRFPHYLGYEDLATTPRLVALAEWINIIPDRPYNYVSRSNSVMTSYRPKHLTDYLEAFSILRNFLVERKLYDRYQDELSASIDKHFSTYVHNMMQSSIPEDSIKILLRGFLHIRKSFEQNAPDIEKLSTQEMAKELGVHMAPFTQVAKTVKAA